MHEDSCSTNLDPYPMCSTSFGDDCIGPPALLCSREDAVVNNGAAAPKSRLPPLEIRSSTAAGGLLPTGEASIVTRTTLNQPSLWLYSTEETNAKKHQLKTSHTTVASGGIICLLSPPAGGLSRQNLQNRVFDSGGSRSSPRLPVFGNVARVALWCGYACWSGW